MRNVAFWVISALLVLGALSAAVALMTLRWLYPQRAAAERSETPRTQVAQPSTPRPGQPDPASKPAGTVDSGNTDPEEQIAQDLIRLAAAGNLKGALALTATLTQPEIEDQVTHINPTPLRTARLPGPADGPVRLLVWTEYRREGLPARGAYDLSIVGTKVTSLQGPLAPAGGYAPLPWKPLDERSRPVDMAAYKGRSLILISPRVPEVSLLDTMVQLQTEYASRGIDVVLVIDIRSPDWVSLARSVGFKGPIWRVKARLEDTPVVFQGRLQGAYGLLVDRDGYVMAPLAALDPSRYGLTDQSVQAVAPTILRAYGLLP